MQAPAPKVIKLFAVLLVVALIGIFAYKAQRYITGPEKTGQAPAAVSTVDTIAEVSIEAEMLTALEWQNVEKLIRTVGASSDKQRQVIELTSDGENPAAIYLRGFVLMITGKPLQALGAFDRLDVEGIPAAYLYPPYRLQRQVRPEAPNRYLGALRGAIDAGSVSPLITARVLAQEGDPSTALSSYLQTDPAQWVTYDVECIKKIGLHAGLSSEMRRMIAGALKSGRVSANVQEPLRQALVLEPDPAEVRAFKRKLKEELILDSSTGRAAVASMKQMLETRQLFLQRNYQTIIDQYRSANPMALPDEAVLLLLLSGARLGNQLEMDRWGQEIKRRYPNQEVIDWVSELTTSAE